MSRKGGLNIYTKTCIYVDVLQEILFLELTVLCVRLVPIHKVGVPVFQQIGQFPPFLACLNVILRASCIQHFLPAFIIIIKLLKPYFCY